MFVTHLVSHLVVHIEVAHAVLAKTLVTEPAPSPFAGLAIAVNSFSYAQCILANAHAALANSGV